MTVTELKHNLGSFVGQTKMKELIVTHIDAARATPGGSFPHLLLLGPPGAGKTTLAGIVADMVGLPLVAISTPPTNRMALANQLNTLGSEGGVLFIDELHEWPKSAQDALLTLLEGGFLDVGICQFNYPRLTVIAATTEREKIGKPLMQRFPLRPAFEPYDDLQLARIAADMAQARDLELSWNDALVFGLAAGGIPRQVRTFITHAVALAVSRGDGSVAEVLEMAGVFTDGLSVDHLDYLARLKEMGGEAGLATLSNRMRLHESEIRDLERLLLDRGLITLTRSGRMLNPAGYQRLNEAA